ncbi:MAG: alpha-1,2-fucosyltransferase [Chlamydiota bacterium]
MTCNFKGQLGNQMFQVAAAIAYALENHCEAIFPEMLSAQHGKGNYENVFFRLNIQKREDVNFSLYNKEGPWPGLWTYIPIPYHAGYNLRLYGYFQTEKYFNKYSEHIRELFSPKKKLVSEIYNKYRFLLESSVPTVAVHIRTFIPDGHNPQAIEFFSWDYFLKAMHYFPENFRFLIFSDAIEYVKKNLPRTKKDLHFIEGNSKYFDFYMMSFCTHQIVSPHSSFSWWAAWLNKNPSKIVMVQSDHDTQNTDAFPESWIKLQKL